MSTALSLPVELTIHGASALHERLLALLAQDGDLTLDASGVRNVDTAGLQLMLATQKSCAAAGKSLSLCDASGPLLEALALYGLSDALPLRPMTECTP
jgi:anti-sigma B factor antagonist